MTRIHVGPPTLPDDVPQINEVFYQAFMSVYVNAELGITTEDIEEYFKGRTDTTEIARRTQAFSHLPRNEQFLVAKEGDRVVGVCRLVIRDEYNQLQAIYVLPEYQGQGVGSEFWSHALTFFDPQKDIVVHVATYNTNAIGFYHKLGFADTGKRFTEERHRMPISGVLIPQMEMRLSR